MGKIKTVVEFSDYTDQPSHPSPDGVRPETANATGSIAAFTSSNPHRSGANTTTKMRRVYLPQYSCEPIVHLGGRHVALAVPFVIDGKIVYDRAGDTPEKYGPPPAK